MKRLKQDTRTSPLHISVKTLRKGEKDQKSSKCSKERKREREKKRKEIRGRLAKRRKIKEKARRF